MDSLQGMVVGRVHAVLEPLGQVGMQKPVKKVRRRSLHLRDIGHDDLGLVVRAATDNVMASPPAGGIPGGSEA